MRGLAPQRFPPLAYQFLVQVGSRSFRSVRLEGPRRQAGMPLGSLFLLLSDAWAGCRVLWVHDSPHVSPSVAAVQCEFVVCHIVIGLKGSMRSLTGTDTSLRVRGGFSSIIN